jgi:hypothetical protein
MKKTKEFWLDCTRQRKRNIKIGYISEMTINKKFWRFEIFELLIFLNKNSVYV